MPNLSLRLSDEEQFILEFAVEKSYYDSKKTFLIESTRHFVLEKLFGVALPDDVNLSDEQIIALIKAERFKEYEKIKGFLKLSSDDFSKVIEQSEFKTLDNYEIEKSKAFKDAGIES